ncbi:alkaline phosphatase-like protein [Gottschalkia acidurici 9a]|uniref:Alkaline phosphatase-like protein n=1 Tax=Gottschalkia acidurici (strain ATCC 7906 / DSM 604 / BCRC 14475 / CIP 104303 / KCTC 5404 / NCIMB 10678 / 9a) TaxID=1128398 RepID=K0AX10_GOTA9|nr:alkaline phosphatase-like protein [Gottschalkia acidurici]AFS78348.1 alkaline phosphatase-like protein [Gottschalkia acidurici 9a]
MRYRNKKAFVLTLLMILILISSSVYASNTNKSDKKVYVVVANKLTLQDINNMENLKNLASTGSLGLMNTKGSNNANSSEGFLSINSSSRAYGRSNYSQAFNLTNQKLSLYKTRVGYIEDNQYQVGNVEINRIKNENLEKSYDSTIGALGDNMHSAGLKTAVFGNSDTDEITSRMGSIIPMDSNGLVDFGNVDSILVKDENYPYGVRTDYEKILKEIKKIKDEVSLTVIDTGDLDRLASYNQYLSDETFNYHRENIIKNIDNFIKELTTEMDDNSTIMIISPNVEQERIAASKLSPIVIWENKSESSILTSGTTRREGIVTNLDIAPTISNILKAPTKNFVGHNIKSIKVDNNIEFIENLDKSTNLVSNLRSPFLTVYNTFTIVTIILSLIVLVLNLKDNKKLVRTIESMTLTIILLPIVLLILPLFNIVNQYIYILVSISMILFTLLILNFISKKYRIWALIFLNFLIITLDIGTGSTLARSSIMGYDPIIGARYFGIGNELVGVLLGSMALTVSFLLDKVNNKLSLVLLPISIVIVAHPSLGANVGGTISILFAVIIFIFLLSNININFRRLMLIGIGVVAIIFAIGVIDIYISPNPTHLGQTFLMILQKGPMFITGIVVRKMQMNIKLIGVSMWGKVLFTSLMFSSIALTLFKDKVRRIFKENKYLDIGLISLIAGSIVGLLVNDSGLLLAAISSMFIVSTIIYTMIISLEKDSSGK